MIQTIEQGFKLAPGTDGKNSFLFDSSRPGLSIDFARKNGYNRIMLNPFHGYTAEDLNCILPLKDQIDELIIGSEKINYKGLIEFSKLKLLGFPDNGKDVIELSKFPDLETLACDYSNRLLGLETCQNLKNITLTSYKSKAKNLSDLPVLKSLEGLNLFKTDISSIQGIERLNSLKKLEIFNAPKLETINSLIGLNLLEEFRVEKCKNIKDYDILENVLTLKKLIISESGEIKSLIFLKPLKKLEFISFWGTNILDGNLSYCEGIPFVGFDNKKHYSHKVEQFKK
jgi:hypothetical protein